MRELDLLLNIILRICAQFEESEISKVDRGLLSASSKDRDLWERVLEILQITQLEAIVYLSLKKNNLTNLIPTNARETLIKAYSLNVVRNKTLFNRVTEVVEALNHRGIYPVLFKGIILSVDCYPDSNARMMKDIDIMIPKERKAEGIAVLTDLGFSEERGLLQKEEVFNGIDRDKTLIDLHFGLKFFEDFDESEIYTFDHPLVFGKAKFKVIKTNPFLAYLIEHQRIHTKHEGLSFKLVYDLLFYYEKKLTNLDVQLLSKYLRSRENLLIFNRVNLFIRELSPKLDLPLIACKPSELLAYTVPEICRSRIFGALGLTRRVPAWARLFLTWLGIVDKKLLSTPNIGVIFSWLADLGRDFRVKKSL